MCFNYWIVVITSTAALAAGTFWLTQRNNRTDQWLQEVNKKTLTQKSGQLQAQDKTGSPIVLDWEKIAVTDPTFAPKMASLSDIFVQAHSPLNVELLRQRPEAVTRVKAMRPFEPLFKNGVEKVDWTLVEKHMKIGMKKFWKNDIATYDQQDICFFVVAHEQGNDKPLGFVQFLLGPTYPYGSIRVHVLMIYPEAQHRGLGKLLISSIFKLVPFVERIFLNTFHINNQAKRAYSSYGFKEYIDKSSPTESESFDQYVTHFEYLTNQTNNLQKTATQIKEISVPKESHVK